MGTFTISLPDSDQRVIDTVAKIEKRSRTKQVQLIIEEWVKVHKPIVS